MPRGLLVNAVALESADGKSRDANADESVLHILHSVDVHAGHSSFSLVLSECRQKKVRFRGERQDRVGSQVLYFFTRDAGYVDAIAAPLGSSGMQTEGGRERDIF